MTSAITALPYGPDAWLLRFAATPGEAAFQRTRWLLHQLESSPPEGLLEYVPGYTTLLLEFTSPEAARSAGQRWLQATLKQLRQDAKSTSPARTSPTPHLHEIPVYYDGPDLQRVANHTGMDVPEVIRRHAAPIYRVALIGFAPGFPYLDGLDPQLVTPRLDTPRPRIGAGSVALGGEHTGIYPMPGPGGWNILGHTKVTLFDLERGQSAQTMCLLHPGDHVRFLPC